MESSKFSVKFYLDDSSKVKLADVVPVFHSWIQLHQIPDHLLIDIADYAHVPDGPGIVLVSHEANIYLDKFDGRVGLSYWRKQALDGSFTNRLRSVFRTALQLCALLESNPALPGAKFRTNEASFKINDRLLAPNTPATFTAVKPDLEKFVRDLYGPGVSLEHHPDPKRLFEVQIKSPAASDLATLTAKLSNQ